MDKRQQRTLDKIHQSFTELLKETPYSQICVQDLLDRAAISRSTFYQHFSSKEDVLLSVCDHIFEHVFSAHLTKEKSHDFSATTIFDYKHIITHIFYHFQDDGELIRSILISEGAPYFIDRLKEKIADLMSAIYAFYFVNKKQVPQNIMTDQLIQSYISLLTYWVKNNCLETPEQITGYFFSIYD